MSLVWMKKDLCLCLSLSRHLSMQEDETIGLRLNRTNTKFKDLASEQSEADPLTYWQREVQIVAKMDQMLGAVDDGDTIVTLVTHRGEYGLWILAIDWSPAPKILYHWLKLTLCFCSELLCSLACCCNDYFQHLVGCFDECMAWTSEYF